MSFSSGVKEELARQFSKGRHCRLAEIAAILAFAGQLDQSGPDWALTVHTEQVALAKKYYTLMKETFGLCGKLEVRSNPLHKGRVCIVSITGKEAVQKALMAVKWMDEDGTLLRGQELVDGVLVKNSCCRRAFIRGAFLAAGSMSDPEKSYHFEIVCTDEEKARQLKELINTFSLDAKIVLRKKNYVVYLKEGAQIVDILNVMEAHVALMNLENVRILKEMRNSVNRQVNCETANINKTVSAAVKQAEDILYIKETAGLGILPEHLREMAELRLQFPEAALKELGGMLDPPVGKSGVNHRLRKICEIAENLREQNETCEEKVGHEEEGEASPSEAG